MQVGLSSPQDSSREFEDGDLYSLQHQLRQSQQLPPNNQNESWISLQTIKDMIRISTEYHSGDSDQRKSHLRVSNLYQEPPFESNDLEIEFNEEVEHLQMKQEIEMGTQEQQISHGSVEKVNKFKRSKQQSINGSVQKKQEIDPCQQEQIGISQSLYTTNNSSKDVLQPLENINLRLNKFKHKRCESNGLQENKGQWQQRQGSFQYNTLGSKQKMDIVTDRCLYKDQYDDKENKSTNNSQLQNNESEPSMCEKSHEDANQASADLRLRSMDKEYDQFCEQVEKIKKQMSSMSNQQRKEPPSLKREEDNVFKQKKANQNSENNLTLKREIKKLERMLEQTKQAHKEEIQSLEVNLRTEHYQKLKEVEEENIMVVEGIKAEFEERVLFQTQDGDLETLKEQLRQMQLEAEQSRVREDMLRQKIERKKEKSRYLKQQLRQDDDAKSEVIRQLKHELDSKDEELSRYKSVCSRPESVNSQMIQFTQFSQNEDSFSQENFYSGEEYLPMTKSMDDFINKKRKVMKQHISMQEGGDKNMLKNLAMTEEREQYLAFVNERSFNYQNSVSHNASSSQDEAMNFSFSEVKNEKVLGLGHAQTFEQRKAGTGSFTQCSPPQPTNNLQILESGEVVSENDEEDYDDEDIDDDEIEQPDSQEEMDGVIFEQNHGTVETQSRQLYTGQDLDESGSENAPIDSAYVSDEDEQDKIVNESSLLEDDQLIMTGRSESAIDEEDDVTSFQQCKAINSSYINLKKNNMLIAFEYKK